MQARMYHGWRTASPGRIARSKGLYDTDINTQIKKSNENPLILSLYDELLKGKTHELLHRNFEAAKK